MQEDQAFQNPDPTRRRLRMLGLAFGVIHLLLPTVGYNSYLFQGYYASLAHDVMSELAAWYLPAGLLALAFLGVSLWKPQPCDWRGVDRVFGVLLVVTTCMIISHVFLAATWRASWYAMDTLRLVYAIALLNIMLFLSSAVLFFVRASWAVVPLGVIVFVTLFPSLIRIERDHPDRIAEYNERMRQSAFREAVDDPFWTAYWETREPEQVAALFAGLEPEARSALSGFMSEDAVDALLARGDDSAFLQTIHPGTRRDEGGAFVHPPAKPQRLFRGFVVPVRYLLYVAFAYVLVGTVLRRRSPPVASQRADSPAE